VVASDAGGQAQRIPMAPARVTLFGGKDRTGTDDSIVWLERTARRPVSEVADGGPERADGCEPADVY
jgi:hypothetical protein